MRLNTQTDYGLRMLMHLAINQNQLITIADVAEKFRISKNHLMKVAHLLGRKGLIETIRGRSGGLRLRKPAASISIGDVVRHLEGDFAIAECFAGRNGQCLITPVCKLKGALAQASNAFLDVLDQYTLDDFVHDNDGLATLLQFEKA